MIYRVTKQAPASTTTQAQITEKNQATKATTAKKTTDSESTTMQTPIDWQKSSETKPYPDLDQVNDLGQSRSQKESDLPNVRR